MGVPITVTLNGIDSGIVDAFRTPVLVSSVAIVSPVIITLNLFISTEPLFSISKEISVPIMVAAPRVKSTSCAQRC